MTDALKPASLLIRRGAELSRRDALKALAAAMAATQAACVRAPGDEIKPYAAPLAQRPGRADYYATSFVDQGFAMGLVVEAHQGRPTKIEGNPRHPASLGAASARAQASIYALYDPQRARAVTRRGLPSSWSAIAEQLAQRDGATWWVVPPESSPLFAWQIERARMRDPTLQIACATPPRASERGAQLALGQRAEVQFDVARAEVVLSLDADMLAQGPASVRWSREFARRRDAERMNRLYVVEPMPTPTGSLADHRLAAPALDASYVALALVTELRALGRSLPELPAALRDAAQTRVRALSAERFVRALAADLHAHAGAALIVVGERQPDICHALGHVLNAALGNLEATLHYTPPALLEHAGARGLEELAEALRGDAVGTLLVLDSNPVYVAPSLGLASLIEKAQRSVCFGALRNETAEACEYHAPLSHYLESWGIARAFDGTLSLTQPLIRPLYEARSMPELLALLTGEERLNARDQVRAQLARTLGCAPELAPWSEALAAGFVEGSAWAPLPLSPRPGAALDGLWQAALAWHAQLAKQRTALELNLADSLLGDDGRFASIAWLEELPQPITKLTWGNAALVSERTALELGVTDEEVVRLSLAQRKLELPLLIVPGHADGAVTVALGYGREAKDEPIAKELGANGWRLARELGAQLTPGLTLTRTGRSAPLARTQRTLDQHERALVLALDVARYRADPDAGTHELKGPLPSWHSEERLTRSPQWAMSIDTSRCSGCGACVVACQAENNVPVVGPEGVRAGREMHWLRIDTYRLFGDDAQKATFVHQPMACQHCEHAPCEYVCPVFATEHSPDGLNEMVYNRCIGTRFCSNNCPYKVRRFNWFHYSAEQETLTLQRNPEVTVRDRGVMEKCTYCVQRIRKAEIAARIEQREIRPGEVITACQATCATGAIQFAALEHAESEMVALRNEPRSYAALHELGARPRTMYLAKLRNPNSALEGGGT